jgi:hypothetical protein
MRSMAIRRLMAVMTSISALWLMTLPAAAATVTFSFTGSDFYIPRPVASSDQEGVLRLLTSYDLAANGFGDLIGTTCSFTVSAANGESVHLYNYGAIVTGGNETDILDTESLPNVLTTTLTDDTLLLGPIIDLYNVMIADDNGTIGTSVDYEVIIVCETEETTTTTEATTTTTTVDTTTTTAPTTTTTLPVTTTSILGTTTTSTGETTTSSVAATSSTTVPPVTGSTLPFTGPVEAAGVAMAASALLLLGAGLLLAAREN